MNAVREIASRQKLNIRMDNCLIEIKDVPFSPLCTVQDWLGLINTADLFIAGKKILYETAPQLDYEEFSNK